jgi:hypothetical protein
MRTIFMLILTAITALAWWMKSDEVTVDAKLTFDDGLDDPEFEQVVGMLANVSSLKTTKVKVSVGTSEEAIPLGECTSPGWAFLKNLDNTNYVEVKTGTGGVIFGKMLPGEILCLRLGSGAQAPYWIANSGACMCKGLIVNT